MCVRSFFLLFMPARTPKPPTSAGNGGPWALPDSSRRRSRCPKCPERRAVAAESRRGDRGLVLHAHEGQRGQRSAGLTYPTNERDGPTSATTNERDKKHYAQRNKN